MSSWAINCHLGQLFPWAKEKLLEKLLQGEKFQDERCYVVGENQPRDRMIHEQPTD